jgi:signal transduction histidine kinase
MMVGFWRSISSISLYVLCSLNGIEAQVVITMLEVTPMQEQQHSEARLSFLGHLAGMLSHEIRNPLNAIFLHLDILDEELRQLSPDDRTQVDLSLVTIKTEVVRLHDLIQDYLALARLSDLQREPEDVCMFLEGVAREVRDRMTARGIILHLEGLGDLGEVSIHKPTLHRAFLNMVQLAVAAMPQGGSLTVRGWRTPSHVHFAVHPTGDSFQPNAAPQGCSASPVTALEEERLALYIAQEIVTAHGGGLEVSSAPGQRTTLAVTLPYA